MIADRQRFLISDHDVCQPAEAIMIGSETKTRKERVVSRFQLANHPRMPAALPAASISRLSSTLAQINDEVNQATATAMSLSRSIFRPSDRVTASDTRSLMAVDQSAKRQSERQDQAARDLRSSLFFSYPAHRLKTPSLPVASSISSDGTMIGRMTKVSSNTPSASANPS